MTGDADSTTTASDTSSLALFGLNGVFIGAALASGYQVSPADILEAISATNRTADNLDTQFRNARLVSSPYEGLSNANSLVATHGTAHAVVLATLGGVRDDLHAFVGYLGDAVTEGEGADELSQVMLERISNAQGGSHTTAAQEDAIQRFVTEPMDGAVSTVLPDAGSVDG